MPLLDLKRQYKQIKLEIDAAIQGVLDKGRFILGENVVAFEQEMSRFVGAGFAVGVASGTDALEISLRALGVGPGDEVITTPFTFIATAEAICAVGARPVFVDIDLDTYNISVTEIKTYLERNTQYPPQSVGEAGARRTTKAIIPVHLYGQSADMEEIMALAREYNLNVVEDCCQAIGAGIQTTRPPDYQVTSCKKVGSFGDCGCFSFFPSKNLGAYGDGGMVVTSNEEIAQRIKMLRFHGAKDKYHHTIVGRNSRLDELQAAILRVKLRRLDDWNWRRRNNAEVYNRLFRERGLAEKIVLPRAVPGRIHAFHLYVIRTQKRDALFDFLKNKGIACGLHYPLPLHQENVYEYLGYASGAFSQAERAAREVISLPFYPEITREEISAVVEAIGEFLEMT